MGKISLISLLFIFIACSEKGKYENGYYEDGHFYFYNGDLGMGQLVNDEKEGFWKHWDSERRLYSEGSYRDNSMHGDWTYFHPNGNTLSQGKRYLNERSGEWKFWYLNGQLMEIRNYQKGINYLLHSWDPPGNAMVINGTGKYHFFNEFGVLREEGYYSEGLQDSIWNYYDKYGNFDTVVYFKAER